MTLEGLVIAKTLGSNSSYWLLSPEGKYFLIKQFAVQTDYTVGKAIAVEGSEAEERGQRAIEADSVKPAGKEIEKRVKAWVEKNSVPHEAQLLVDNAVTRKLEPFFTRAAHEIAESVLMLTPIVVRFHDDADGAASALELQRAVFSFAAEKKVPFRKSFFSANADSYFYEEKFLRADLEWAQGFPEKKPLLVLADHASNEESIPALEQARSAFKTIVIDHHPPAEDFSKHVGLFVSAFAFDRNVEKSDYNAGYLAFEVARRFAPLNQLENLELLAFASMHADHSRFAPRERGVEEALALEFLSSGKIDLQEVYEDFFDARKREFAFKKATVRLKQMRDAARKTTRVVEAGKFLIQVIKLSSFVKKSVFPQKAKCVNVLHDDGEARYGKPLVTIGFTEDAASFRVSQSAHALGFKANDFIASLQTEMPHAIESGGGHDRASAMRFKKEFSARVFEGTVEELKRVLQTL
ncbi:hypothetical protein H0N96_03195 [Candidatus Micrarchaeota archaeon]|nr:hypothetical protein [Candidatus Micrarchaeota archaeon]